MDQGVLTFTTVALLVAVTMTAQNLLRFLKAKDWNGVVSIVLACVIGYLLVLLAANSEVSEGMHLITDGPALGDLDAGSLIMLGVAFGTGASTLVDFRNAIDNSTTAAKPKLLG